MNREALQERSTRVRALNRILAKLYPYPKIALTYHSTWELLVAVQLSAQCTDARVNQVTERLFKMYRTLEVYRDAPRAQFEKAIYSCGYYHNKARNIQEAARKVLADFSGEVPQTMEELLTIPGVARKTANVILSNAFQVHEGIAVDTHVRRFAIRFNLTDYTDPVRIERDLMEIVPQKEWWGFNHRLVHYGRDVCPARKHMCKNHPLTKVYLAAAAVWPRAR